ncbi:RNA-directed DNA polymerase from mobile element jockey [Amphibalanus amphitrite]|uniref:RNA-directed DNA polymerase from mobile element jockey n=1 Tax=Amphibalanus amphitrite TaxID=1232801 RepID=A0A6A4W3A9_AMPAM|nr:RNA-directed DNA polymerase from mobile element jockey [Amphibalanus amphitrite]
MRPTTPNRLVPIPGYQLVRRDRPDNRGYGGVAIAARESLELTTMERPGPPVAGSKLESLWVQLRAGSHRVMVCAAYRPPVQTQTQVSADLDELEEQIQHVLTRHSGPIVIAGDLNINISGDTTASTRLRQLLTAYSFKQHVTGPTYPSSGSTIDLICTTHGAARAGTLNCTYSPHNWTRALLPLPNYRPRESAVTARCWSRLDRDEVNRLLAAVDWSPVFTSDNPEVQWDYFLARSFREFASTELNRPAALGRVTKLLRKMEGAVMDACPGQAVSGDRGQLVAECRSKAEAFVRTYASVSRHTRHRKRDRAVKADLKRAHADPCICEGQLSDACRPFSRQEMLDQMRKMKNKKAPGMDGVCTEHLRHLGPLAQEVMLRLFNLSWRSAEVPSVWRRAVIIPIPKAGKDPQDVTSYRPISLTSHIAKLMERMVSARVTHLLDRDNVIPAEQVSFRRGRSAEENLGRLIQEVQDGWNLPAPKGRPSDGKTAARFVLTAYDFSRAYDVIDHQMLRLEMLHRLPRCYATWIFHFLRDRRACAEVNGVRSSSRPFRAGLPQGSVLAPTLFTLWSADLVEELRKVDGTSTYMYADDTATLSSGATIAQAMVRAQRAADVMAAWARKWKMRLAGSKTQVLVLSQRHEDARDIVLRVDGTAVKGTRHLHLLGVTFDRLLHFGEHCSRLRRKVKPRVAQLRKLTARSWGLQEPQLRTVANGYVRGALEYAAAAWLPAASESHVELLEREMRATARVVTGCPISTPRDPLMAEAGMVPVRARREALAVRLTATAASQRTDDPLREVAARTAPRRLRTTTGWRDVGREALTRLGLQETPVEERLHITLPPWSDCSGVAIRLDVGAAVSREARDDEEHLATLPDQATWIWSDGSAEGGVASGGSGALITLPSGEERTTRTPAGAVCSSTRAELVAMRAALEEVQQLEDATSATPLVLCTDSQAALATLATGAGEQRTTLGAEIWRLLLAAPDRPTWLHLTKAVGRAASKAWRDRWPDSFFRRIMRDRFPTPVLNETREDAVNVHQLRAGHWGLSTSYLHRIGRHPTPTCQQCEDLKCPAALCLVCREEADTPEHVLLHCPCLAGMRLRLFGNIHPDATRLRDGGAVAALARGFLRHREPAGYGRP